MKAVSEFSEFDKAAMQQALAAAKQAASMGEVPVGAVISIADSIVATGFNQPITHADPTAHAEIMALRMACESIQNYRLPATACLYVTLEPCTMCIGALIHARLPRLVFATAEPRAGAVISQTQLLDHEHYNHRITYEHGLYAEQSSDLLKAFFRARRHGKNMPPNL